MICALEAYKATRWITGAGLPKPRRKVRAEGCMARGSNSGVLDDPLGEPGRTPLTACRSSVRLRLCGRWPYIFRNFVGGLLNWGLWEIWMNEWMNKSFLWKRNFYFHKGSVNATWRVLLDIKLSLRPIQYRAVNTPCLGYKNHSVNIVEGNIRCLFFWDQYKPVSSLWVQNIKY
jgi:hypothetical protein